MTSRLHNLTHTTLRALERDEIDSLPGGIFTRGFVSSYADAVGLDPRKTLAQFVARFPEQSSVASLDASVGGRANEAFFPQQRTAGGLVWFALLAVLLAVGLFVVLRDDGPAANAGAPTPQEVRAGSRVPSATDPPPASADRAATSAAVGSPRSGAAPPAADGRLTLEMRATADCWVRAAVDGETVVVRLLRAGDREVVVARGPIDLKVGNAGGFAFTINERPGRTLGVTGEVVNLQVTPSNYLRFLAD